MAEHLIYKVVRKPNYHKATEQEVFAPAIIDVEGLYTMYKIGVQTVPLPGSPLFVFTDLEAAHRFCGWKGRMAILQGTSTTEPFLIEDKTSRILDAEWARTVYDVNTFWETLEQGGKEAILESYHLYHDAWRVQSTFYGVYDFTPQSILWDSEFDAHKS